MKKKKKSRKKKEGNCCNMGAEIDTDDKNV